MSDPFSFGWWAGQIQAGNDRFGHEPWAAPTHSQDSRLQAFKEARKSVPSYTYQSAIMTKYGLATDQQMDKALELTRALNYHPAMNIVPVVEFVQQADRMGCDIIKKPSPTTASPDPAL